MASVTVSRTGHSEVPENAELSLKLLMTPEQIAHPLFCIGNQLFRSRFDGRQHLWLRLLRMLLDGQFLYLIPSVVEGGVGNLLAHADAVSQRRRTTGTHPSCASCMFPAFRVS